jgi:hypothetical protein
MTLRLAGGAVQSAEHSRFKRHSSLTESHLQMSDNRSYVNYTRLHTYGIPPLYPSQVIYAGQEERDQRRLASKKLTLRQKERLRATRAQVCRVPNEPLVPTPPAYCCRQ